MCRATDSNIILDFLCTVFIVLYSIIKTGTAHIFSLFWFLPGRYKTISQDIILITGGGKGIGRLIAVEFAKHSPKQIILWGRHEDTLSATTKVITLLGVSCSYMVCDVGVYEQVHEKGKEIKEKFGDVTICVNNAGIVFGNSILNSQPAQMDQTLKVNTTAHFWTTQLVLPAMMEKNCGHIVFMNSMLGLMGLAGAADYSSSKFGAAGFAESLKLEIAKANKTGVHVTTIHPFMIDTDMFAGCATRFPKLFPPLEPEYVAWKSVDAILTNSYMVLLPRFMYILVLVKNILPVDAMISIHRFTGVDCTMDSFHGRKKNKQQ